VSQQAGLSFDQAPPFLSPLRFFLTAPLFLMVAGVLLVVTPDALSSRWTPQALALTHALTLGFLGMVMTGALMQMLPVVAGAVIPAAPAVAWLTHVPLLVGTVALMAGFAGAGGAWLVAGAVLLSAGLGVFLAAAGISLARAVDNATVTGMRLAVISLALVLGLGAGLALMRAGLWAPAAPAPASVAHVAFGLLGWVLLLVVGVGYLVVPMFQMTPPYPPRLARWLAPFLFALLGVHALSAWLAPQGDGPVARLASLGLAGGILAFAAITLRLQSRRRRKLADVTLDFWRLAMASLVACAAAWLAAALWPAWRVHPVYPIVLGVVFLMGFAASVVMGMLYKIVPFLAWFHLQAQLQAKAGTIPNMKQMIAESRMRLQFRLHFVACLLLVTAAIRPGWFAALAGGATALSGGLLWANLLAAARRFLRHGGRLR
jgi:hypothetical protein